MLLHSKDKYRQYFLLTLFFSSLFLIRCSEEKKTSSSLVTQQMSILPVAVKKIKLVNSYKVFRYYTGEIRPRRSSKLSFERSGKLAMVLVDEGVRVSKGTVLAKLRTRELEAKRLELLAQRESLAASLEEMEKGPKKETIAAAKSTIKNLKIRLKQAIKFHERRLQLHSSKSISGEEVEDSLFQMNALQAILDKAKHQLAELESGTRPEKIRGQKAQLSQLAAKLKQLAIEVESCTLKAPFDGIITRCEITEGEMVFPEKPVIYLIEDHILEAHIKLPPLQASLLKVKDVVQLQIAQKKYSAEVTTFWREVDSQTRTLNILFTITEKTSEIYPGQIARLELKEKIATKGYWIPITALVKGSRGLWFCFTLKEKENHFFVQKRVLQILHNNNDSVLIKGNFKPEEFVILTGTHRVVPGQQVQPVFSAKDK